MPRLLSAVGNRARGTPSQLQPQFISFCRRRVEDLTHLLQQCFHSKRLLQERKLRTQSAALRHGVFGITRQIEDSDARAESLQCFSHLPPSHSWHDYVGYQKLDFASVG